MITKYIIKHINAAIAYSEEEKITPTEYHRIMASVEQLKATLEIQKIKQVYTKEQNILSEITFIDTCGGRLNKIN